MNTRLNTRLLGTLTLTVLTAALTAPVLAQSTRLSEPAGGFSYTVPAGWRVKDTGSLKYKGCFAKPANGFAPNIVETDETAAMTLDAYLKASMTAMKRVYQGFHVVSRTPFATASGTNGVRMAVTGTLSGKSVYQVFYVFPAANNRKIIATATWLASDGPKYVAPVNSAMKTFKLQ